MGESKGRKYNYEAMFLVSQSAASDFGGCVEHIKAILERHGEGLIAMKKWDERRLAYEIEKQKRGIYILAYFACDPVNVEKIDRECNLSETILRCLIVRADHLTVEEMQAADGQAELAAEIKLRESGGEPSEEASQEAPASA